MIKSPIAIAVLCGAVATLSLTGSAANADTYETIPINVSFQFAPTTGTTLTANTGILSAATTTITATTNSPDTLASSTSFSPYAVTAVSGNNIGLMVGTAINFLNPTPLTPGAVLTKAFTTSFGPFNENLIIRTTTFIGAGLTAGTAGASSPMALNTLVVNATGTISFAGEETAATGFGSGFVSLTATYTQPAAGGLITASIIDTTITPLPGALPLFAAGLALLGLLGWRRKRKVAA